MEMFNTILVIIFDDVQPSMYRILLFPQLGTVIEFNILCDGLQQKKVVFKI